MSKSDGNTTSWEDVFENLTEDISTYRWLAEQWDDLPEGYDSGTLLWDILNSRSRGLSGLVLIKTAPDKYKNSVKALNDLWERAEKELKRSVQKDHETINGLFNTVFVQYLDSIEERLNSVRKIAQDGDLIGDPDWFEDDLRDAGNDFLIEFQQLANLVEQAESDIFSTDLDVSLLIKKYNRIDELFKKSFGYFHPLSDSLSDLNNREYAKNNWWLSQHPEKDDIEVVEVPDDLVDKLILSYKKSDDEQRTDCPESEKAFLYAFGELPADARSDFKTHVDRCGFCTQLVNDLRTAEMRAGEEIPAEIEMPAELAKAIEDQRATKTVETPDPIKSVIFKLRNKVSDFFTFPKMLSTVAVACLAVVIIYSGFLNVGEPEFGTDLTVIRRVALGTGSLAMGNIIRGASGFKEIDIEPGSAVTSADRLKIRIQIKMGGFYYLLLKNNQGDYSPLNSGYADPGSELILPDHKGYQLSKTKGRETIILVVSETKIKNFNDKIKTLQKKPLKKVFPKTEIKVFWFNQE